MHQDVRRGNEGVWKPLVKKDIHITPINTASASVTTLVAATPTTCLCAVTLCWIQSSSRVTHPHLCTMFLRIPATCRHVAHSEGPRSSRCTTT